MTAADVPVTFNALTDPWLPVIRQDGTTVWSSFVDVLSGERDGPDLDYPRDDFRVFARLLLSALVQALLPAKNKAELLSRLGTPIPRSELLGLIAPVRPDFDLFGPRPFLQDLPAGEREKGAAPFVFPREDLFRAPTSVDAVAIPIALVQLFVEQTYAGGAGRGYGAGPGGQPGAFTLVDPDTVRTAAWANTLTLDRVRASYAAEDAVPWSNVRRNATPRAAIGLVTGLFFQTRSSWLESAGWGRCSFSGVEGRLVRLAPLGPKSELAKKTAGTEDLWQHPCAPLAVNSTGIGAVRLKPDRPAWTGLAQLLAPLSRAKTKTVHPKAGPAPVLQQWRALEGRSKRPRLLVLDYDRDKANVKRRFFETLPLTEGFIEGSDAVERLRSTSDDAQEVCATLLRCLKLAHDTRKVGGLALADAESMFWARSEPPFLAWLASEIRTDEDEEGDEREAARRRLKEVIRGCAIDIFDAHIEISEFDPRKQELIAKARRRLRAALFPPAKPPSPRPAAHEVTQ